VMSCRFLAPENGDSVVAADGTRIQPPCPSSSISARRFASDTCFSEAAVSFHNGTRSPDP
ncbi:MAG: hypothetical protein WBE26_10645, partial [Phycisphaerae bacterium]